MAAATDVFPALAQDRAQVRAVAEELLKDERLADFDPRRVLFAHDCSVWEPADSNRAEEQGSPQRR